MKQKSVFFPLLKHFMHQEFAARERVITPLLFAAVILLLFAFTLPEPPPEWQVRMLVAQCLISSFFALQIALSRAFESESQDRVFDMLRTSPLNGTAFITAKLTHVIIMGAATLLMTVVITSTMQGFSPPGLSHPASLAMGVLTLVGLSSLGVLLAVITLKAQAKQVLFPLLYFPLCTPVLIAGSEFLCRFLEKPVWDDTSQGWFIVLAAFDVIYLTLAVLMGSDAVSAE